MLSIPDAPVSQLVLLAVVAIVLGTVSGLSTMLLTMWWERRKERTAVAKLTATADEEQQ